MDSKQKLLVCKKDWRETEQGLIQTWWFEEGVMVSLADASSHSSPDKTPNVSLVIATDDSD